MDINLLFSFFPSLKSIINTLFMLDAQSILCVMQISVPYSKGLK